MTLVQTKPGDFSTEQIDLIKSTVAAGTTDLELALFLEVAKSTGLNPFQRQIYAIKRKSGREEKMTIQTGIDGYRLIASRTGTHLGTTDAEYGPVSAEGYPEWARVTVKRLVQGHVAEFPATARWSEYVQTKDEWVNQQRTGKKIVGDMWAKMPRTMLAKCAEALALRKAFPAELSGVYADVEMQQADNATPVQVEKSEPSPELLAAQEKVEKMARRVAALTGQQAVTEMLKLNDLNTIKGNADTYSALVALGKLMAEKQAEPAPAESVGSDLMITAEQTKQLQTLARSVGADTPARRHAFWGHALNLGHGIKTVDLTEEQAAAIWAICEPLDVDGRKQLYEEARRELLGGGV